MTFPVHNQRYESGELLHNPLVWPNMRIEHRLMKTAVLPPVTTTCTSIAVVLTGRSPVRWRGGDAAPRVMARPGIASLLPMGLDETEVEITSPVETLHIFLAPSVTDTSALTDYDIDPARAQLVHGAGLSDPLLAEMAVAFHAMISRSPEPTDRLFVEGAGSMLAAHLVSKYSNVRWRPPNVAQGLPYQRLKRVIDLVESRFTEEIGLSELAAEACLSPFHFSRLFRKATGLSPHRYVTERRIQDAKARLAKGRLSFVEIALEAGFGSQANFNRLFRKHTGMTPGQFRTDQRP
jgi:AraC family transcriptional regulator